VLSSEALVGLPDLEVTGVCYSGRTVCVSVRYIGERSCPFCGGLNLRDRGRRVRRVRHESFGERHCELELETRKWLCRNCGKSFWQRFPGILPGKRSSEPFRRSVANQHRDGINRSCLSRREQIGSATVHRWFNDCLGRLLCEVKNAPCPRVLGIDEHFFSKKDGYATTFCDLAHRKVYDVVLGRSEASLEGYLTRLKGKELVEVVCMDLSSTYRAIVKKHFPKAKIVADRFHVIRLVNHHFLATWKMLDPAGSKSRGLLSLMRRHRANLKSPEQADRLQTYLSEMPVLKLIYEFKQDLCRILLHKHCKAYKCRELAKQFLKAVDELIDSKLEPLVTLGETLRSWQEEVARMWRFTKNNGITEGFHNKMESITRQAYGFRNFENYRLRVRVMCS
jgi:transposase